MTEVAPIQIEVWSDVACPWCLLGNAHLREAIVQSGIPADVTMRSYQLSPDLDHVMPVQEYLEKRYGNGDRIAQSHQRLTEMGAQVGLKYQFEKALVANTFDAHRLHHFAKSHGLGAKVMEGLLLAQHTNGDDVSSHGVLRNIGIAAGLDPGAVDQLLNGDEYAEAVRGDIEEGQAIGVQGVPFFVFDRKFAVSGAQPIAAFKQALAKAQAEAA